MTGHPDWYFTKPWEPVKVRRGDALGFRAGADYFADTLAPGLSNATVDARWISLLSWCLKWSDRAWQKAGGCDLSSRKGQQARYAWLQPLELLWVDRALESGQCTGERVTSQLPGRRSIERWRNNGSLVDGEGEFRFGMNDMQFARYRQTGAYGAYRVVFRTVDDLTMMHDGWTPGPLAHQLAERVNNSLARDMRLTEKDFEKTRWGRWQNQEARYWADMKSGRWKSWRSEPVHGFLPTSKESIAKLEESELLSTALFAAGTAFGRRRRATAVVLAGAKADSHAGLVDVLANSDNLAKALPTPGVLDTLPAFTRFADAAMFVMRCLWNMNDEKAHLINKTAEKLQFGLELMHDAARAWLKLRVGVRNAFPHEAVVTQLAQAIHSARTLPGQLSALLSHHQTQGGGLRWFREQDSKIVRLATDAGGTPSDYRFRLFPLSRLAAQCGVARMNNVFDALGQYEFDDLSENNDEESSDENGDDQ